MADLFPLPKRSRVHPTRVRTTQRLLITRIATSEDALRALLHAPFGGWPLSDIPVEASRGLLAAIVALKEAKSQLCRTLEAVRSVTPGEE